MAKPRRLDREAALLLEAAAERLETSRRAVEENRRELGQVMRALGLAASARHLDKSRQWALQLANLSRPDETKAADAGPGLDSIARLGVLEPIMVEDVDGENLRVIDGHRRLAAAREAGLKSIPMVVLLAPTTGSQVDRPPASDRTAARPGEGVDTPARAGRWMAATAELGGRRSPGEFEHVSETHTRRTRLEAAFRSTFSAEDTPGGPLTGVPRGGFPGSFDTDEVPDHGQAGLSLEQAEAESRSELEFWAPALAQVLEDWATGLRGSGEGEWAPELNRLLDERVRRLRAGGERREELAER